MIYSAKIRRMSRRRQKIAVRRKLRNILRADLQPFIGQRIDRETLARMRAAVSLSMQHVIQDLARLMLLAAEARRARSDPPAIRTPVFYSTL